MSSFSGNIGAELNNREKLYASVKPQQQPQAQAASEQAVQAKDQKSSGVAWTKSGDGQDKISTQEENDTLSLSFTSVSLSSSDSRPVMVRAGSAVKENLNGFRRSLVDNIKSNIESAVRKQLSYDKMQSRFGASDLDGIMSKLYLRLGPAMLASLGEDPEMVADIKARVIGQLKGENCDKMTSCVESEIRLRIYGA